MLLTTPRLIFALAAGGIAAGAAVPSAQAASPGDNGKIAYVKPAGESTYELRVMDADGTHDVALVETGESLNPVWSPDGTKIAYEHRPHQDTDLELRVYDLATGQSKPLTSDNVDQRHPTWSPDGTWIAYDEGGDILKRSSDPQSKAQPVVLNDEESEDAEPAWSPDGRIAFRRTVGDWEGDIRVMPGTGGQSTPVADSDEDESLPDWSPDGKRLTYSVANDIAIRTVGEDDEQIVSPDPEVDADGVFSPDGTKVLWSSSRRWRDQWGTRLFLANAADGTGDAPLSETHADAIHPDWQPLNGPPPAGEPKPTRPAPPAPVTAAGQVPAAGTTGPAAAPRAARAGSRIARQCVSKRSFRIRLRVPRGEQIAAAKVTVNGKPAKVTLSGRRHTAKVDLRKLPRGRWSVKVTATLKSGRTVKEIRRYRTCTVNPRRAR
jgi:hypothetical protein